MTGGDGRPVDEQVSPDAAPAGPVPTGREPSAPNEGQPTEQDRAERARRANRATRGAMAGVLALEALVVLLLPRALAFSDGGLGATKTVLLVVLAVLMVTAGGLLRRPWGIGVGSALQVVFLLTGLWLFAVLVVAAILVAVWVRLLFLRHDLVGTPGGWKLLYS